MPPTQSQLESEPRFKIFTGVLKAYTNADGRKALHCTASSNIEDLHGDTMTDACVRDMAEQAKAKGMTIFLNHKYEVPEDVFGKTVNAQVALRSEGVTPYVDMDLDVEVDETNPRANQTYDAIDKSGVKLGVSIGAIVEEWEFKDKDKGFWGGMTIKQVNLLEASIVGIPANPRSWVRNGVFAIGKAYGMEDSELKKMLDKAIEDWEIVDETGEEDEETGDVSEDEPIETEPEPDEVLVSAEPELTTSHNELPDSAFACIESGGKKDDEGKTTPRSLRHYPHHTASGGIDKALLRNALSRIGDKNNIQCGKSHLMAHARSEGIGEKTADAFEIKLGEEVWILQDTQTDIEHEPETSEGFDGDCHCSDEDVEVENDLDLAPDGDNQVSGEVEMDLAAIKSGDAIADKQVDADVVAMLRALVSLIEEKDDEISRVTAERQALTEQLAEKDADLSLATEIVDKLSNLPLARKSSAKRQVSSFKAKFAGTYPEEWLELIEDRNKESSDGS